MKICYPTSGVLLLAAFLVTSMPWHRDAVSGSELAALWGGQPAPNKRCLQDLACSCLSATCAPIPNQPGWCKAVSSSNYNECRKTKDPDAYCLGHYGGSPVYCGTIYTATVNPQTGSCTMPFDRCGLGSLQACGGQKATSFDSNTLCGS